MSKRTVFTTISPLPAGVGREIVLDFLHDHDEMIRLNPLVRERHPIPAPADAPDEERRCTWYAITDRIAYLPGGLASGDVSYTCAFYDLPDGIQTHCRAPLGVDIREKWTLAGTLPGEPPEPVELGLGAPAVGLYLREDVDLRCNLLAAGFVRKNLRRSHAKLVAHLVGKARRLSFAAAAAAADGRPHGRHLSELSAGPPAAAAAAPGAGAGAGPRAPGPPPPLPPRIWEAGVPRPGAPAELYDSSAEPAELDSGTSSPSRGGDAAAAAAAAAAAPAGRPPSQHGSPPRQPGRQEGRQQQKASPPGGAEAPPAPATGADRPPLLPEPLRIGRKPVGPGAAAAAAAAATTTAGAHGHGHGHSSSRDEALLLLHGGGGGGGSSHDGPVPEGLRIGGGGGADRAQATPYRAAGAGGRGFIAELE